jgi:cysteine synthase
MVSIPGNTKLVRLKNIEMKFSLSCHLYGKLENSNPSGSIKDRAVYQMLCDLKADNKLNKDTIIIEATSGNTGIGLAYYTKEFGYRLIIYMPKSMSMERRKMISSLGGELVLVDGGMQRAEEEAIEAVKNTKNSILFDQFNNPSNVKAHYLTTGPEILRDLPSVAYCFAGIGTGGTISGIAKFFAEHKPSTKMIGVEPLESPLLTKGQAGPHLIQGIGANFVPSILRKDLLADIEDVPDKEAIFMAQSLRKLEEIDVGISSGAALLGALQYIESHHLDGKDIVVIFPDKGDRYSW